MRFANLFYPKILFYFWSDENREINIIFNELNTLPAYVTHVSKNEIFNSIQAIPNNEVVACVFVISRNTFSDKSFEAVLNACMLELDRRKEFRLFVHLLDLNRQDLFEIADSEHAAADLIDSVHISDASNGNNIYNLVKNIENHLKKIPEILDYLKYQKLKQFSTGMIQILNIIYILLLTVGWFNLIVKTQDTLYSDILPWTLAMFGSICYLSFLSACSFGSNIRTGTYFRIGMALFPLWIINIMPFSKLNENWLFLIAGFGISLLIDWARRIWVQSRREQIQLQKKDEFKKKDISVKVVRNWQMLTTAPILGKDPNVFISYSRSSNWSTSSAIELNNHIKYENIPSFLDTEELTEGMSWRHKLQQAIAKATIFITIQDLKTAERHWPDAELSAAIQSQNYCGLPSIIIIRDASLTSENIRGKQEKIIYSLLSHKGETDPELLRIIDSKPETPQYLARGLKNNKSISVINPYLDHIFQFLIVPLRILLASIGAIGAGVSIIAYTIMFILYLFGTNIVELLMSSNFCFPVAMLASFWIGFITRLLPASRYELRVSDSERTFWWHLISLFPLLSLLRYLVPVLSLLSVVYLVISLGIGFLSACDFINKTISGTDRYRQPPI